jgi:hypothetical protein
MLTRPTHIFSPPAIGDPEFTAYCRAWTVQMCCEMREVIARARQTLVESGALIKEADRVLATAGCLRVPISGEPLKALPAMDAAA